MRYLITGGAGFIGSHLVESLLKSEHCVDVVDDLSTGSSENLARIMDHPRFRFFQKPVQACSRLPELIADSDAVFHLAAAVGVELVVRYPVRTLKTNVHGAERVCELASKSGTRLLIASTSEVYGRAINERFQESDDLVIGPPTHYRWSYAASKLLDEFLALACHKERGLPVTIARLFNTVGPRQTGTYGMVLPRFVAAARAGEPLRVYGDGTQVRCFCHVEDTVRALIGLSVQDAAIGGIYNIGSEQSISIADLARQVIEVLGSDSGIEYIPYDQAYEPGFEDMLRRVPATGKIRSLLDWHPRKSLTQTISEVNAWLEEVGC